MAIVGKDPVRSGKLSREMILARRRALTAELYLAGARQTAIARELGISQQTVSRDLACCLEEWRRQQAASIERQRAWELARLDALEREHWGAWRHLQRRSSLDAILGIISKRSEILRLHHG